MACTWAGPFSKAATGLLPKAYFTLEAHYSVQILRDLLGLDTVIVDTLPDGDMSPDDLGRKLDEHKDAPALVVATVGTTFKGAVDRVSQLQETLAGHESYVHVTRPLFGGYCPSRDTPIKWPHTDPGSSGRYDSIAISCHKFFGFPSPPRVCITRQSLYDEFNALSFSVTLGGNPEYIHHVPGAHHLLQRRSQAG